MPGLFKRAGLAGRARSVFARPAAHAFAPHPEARGFHFALHDFDDLGLRQAGLSFDVIKRSLVIPRHGDNFRWGERACIGARGGGDEIVGELAFCHEKTLC